MAADARPSRRLTQRLRHASWTFRAGVYELLVEREPDNVDHMTKLGEAYTRIRRFRSGLEIDQRLVACEPDNPVFRYNLACSHTLTGDLDRARDALLTALDLGFRDIDHLMGDPDLRRLRDDARFSRVLERLEELGEAT